MQNPSKSQRAIRKRAITLEYTTSHWVVPQYIHELIDNNKFTQAQKALDKQAEIWPQDPEITRVRSLIYFLIEKP